MLQIMLYYFINKKATETYEFIGQRFPWHKKF